MPTKVEVVLQGEGVWRQPEMGEYFVGRVGAGPGNALYMRVYSDSTREKPIYALASDPSQVWGGEHWEPEVRIDRIVKRLRIVVEE